MFWKLILAIVVIAGLGGAVYLSDISKAQVKDAFHYVEKLANPSESHAPLPPEPVIKEKAPWDGLVTVSADNALAIGIQLATVEAERKPITLELTGRTAYDPNTLTKIRPRFDTLVEEVYPLLGARVKRGDPLIELHSTDLAAAKSDLQSKYVQWQHDLKLFYVREELVKTGAISKQLWVDTVNDEMKSRLDYHLAMDKLKILKVPPSQIEPLLAPLGDANSKSAAPGKIADKAYGEIEDKAKMTLVSPADGIVIEREAVKQNFYETSTVLMVIAPLDHLWVMVNVYELDQDKVKVGQTMEIVFPFLQQRIQGTVQYVASEVSKDTHAVKVVASIPNPGGRLKSDMLVKALLDIPPAPGQTVIPRQSMISANGQDYVFVRKPDGSTPGAKSSGNKGPLRFQRRKIVVAQENHDQVVIDQGLKPGEEVATTGSLILSQLYDDEVTVTTGAPAE
jgi:cobalt-zinc-cadmium efflux system membrane fusion protein